MDPLRSLSAFFCLLATIPKENNASNRSPFWAAVRVLSLLATLTAVSASWAQEPAEIPTLAPLNPHFVEYMKGFSPSPLARLATTPKGHALGLIPSTLDFSHLTGQPGLAEQAATNLPASYDLRNYDKVSPVKNQLQCGDCWAFATYASMESALLKGESWNFSENNLNNLNGFDMGACKGGNGQMSTAYLARWAGPINATDDPDPTSCKTESTCFNPSPQNLVPQKHVQGVFFIAPRANSTDNSNLKTAIMNYGGVHSTISADELPNSPSTWGTSTSYWNANNSAYYYNGALVCLDAQSKKIKCLVDHSIALVGWDDNYLATNFSTAPPGNGAFLVKNSWGTAFGSGGFFWISYYDVQLATWESYVYGVDSESSTNYTTEYQYDPLGFVNGKGYTNSTTAWAANIFTAAANGQLLAVATYPLANNTSYTIEIYTNASKGPTSGTLATTTTGTISLAGYSTIVLPTPVAITKGQKFSVVIKLTTPGYYYPIPVEYALAGYSSLATASPGQSYVSPDGTNWQDTTAIDSTMNVALKAFSNEPKNTVTISSFTITPATIVSGGTASLNITLSAATPTGGAVINMTSSNSSVLPVTSSYSIAAGQSSVSTGVIAGNVTASTSITVTASYNGSSKQAQVIVNPVAKTTPAVAIAISPASITTLQPLTVTVTVSPTSGKPIPTGTVTLTSPKLTTQSGPVNSSGIATIIIAAGMLPVGADTLTATYSGDSQYNSAYGTKSVTVSAPPAAFAISANTTSQTVTQGSNASFTLTVQSKNGFHAAVTPSALNLPTGYVVSGTAWNPPTVTPAANGTASSTLTVVTNSSTTPGTYNVTLQAAATGYTAQTLPVTIVVNQAAGFAVSANTNSQTVTQGKNASFTLTVQSKNGFHATVTPAALNLPTGYVPAGSAWSPLTITPTANGTASSMLTVVTNSNTTPGTYNVTLQAAATGYTTQTVPVTIIVSSAAKAPTATTGSATGITTSSATLNGTVNPNGTDTHVWFLWGTNSSLSGANQSSSYDLGSGTSAPGIAASPSGLNPGTPYYFQMVAQNSAGTAKGTINSFSTTAAAGCGQTFCPGDTVTVYGAALNLRTCVSTSASCTVIVVMPIGTTMKVVGGPTQSDGIVWWDLGGVVSGISRVGWASGGYLKK